MDELKKQIKENNLKHLYVFYGDEDYLKRYYKNELIKATVNEGDTMNFSTLEGPRDPIEIINLVNTPPFFAPLRVILAEKSGLFAKSDEKFTECLKNIPDSAMLIFIEEKVNLSYGPAKAAQKHGMVVKFDTPDPKMFEQWAIVYLKRYGKQISRDAWEEFTHLTPNDMNTTEKELSKLIDYCWDKDSISIGDVRAIVTKHADSQIFKMIEGMAEKNLTKVMHYYHDILGDKNEKPLGILTLITKQFRQMLWLKALKERGASDDEILHEMKLSKTGVIRRIYAVAKNFSEEQIYAILADITELDGAIKTGNMVDRMAVEMLLVKYSK